MFRDFIDLITSMNFHFELPHHSRASKFLASILARVRLLVLVVCARAYLGCQTKKV